MRTPARGGRWCRSWPTSKRPMADCPRGRRADAAGGAADGTDDGGAEPCERRRPSAGGRRKTTPRFGGCASRSGRSTAGSRRRSTARPTMLGCRVRRRSRVERGRRPVDNGQEPAPTGAAKVGCPVKELRSWRPKLKNPAEKVPRKAAAKARVAAKAEDILRLRASGIELPGLRGRRGRAEEQGRPTAGWPGPRRMPRACGRTASGTCCGGPRNGTSTSGGGSDKARGAAGGRGARPARQGRGRIEGERR